LPLDYLVLVKVSQNLYIVVVEWLLPSLKHTHIIHENL
jgi:hypothetical protein